MPVQQLYPPQSEETFKASYDELIDEYAVPPTLHSYPIDPSRQPYPMPMKMSMSSDFSSKDIETTSEENLSPQAYPPTSVVKEADPKLSLQKFLPDSWACRLYVITVLIETTIDLAIEGELYSVVRNADLSDLGQTTARRMPVYLSIFAIAHVFQFILAVDAVYNRNTLQFIALTIFNGLFLVYAIIQIGEINSAILESVNGNTSNIPVSDLTMAIPIVISVAEVAYIALGWRIYNEFGWKVYKYLGADIKIKKLYANLQIFECLIKFDVFFWLGFSIQFIWLVLQPNNWEYYVTCAALPLSILLLVEGHLAARHENRWMMITFMSGCVGAMVYFIYKLVEVVANQNADEYYLVYKTLIVFSVVAIVLLLVTFVFSIMIMCDFGRGLKESIARNKHRPTKSYGNNAGPMSANPYRMSID